MWKYKGGDEGKQPLDARVYPMISVDIKPPLVHIVESLNKSIASRQPSLFWGPLDSPQRLGDQGSRQVLRSP